MELGTVPNSKLDVYSQMALDEASLLFSPEESLTLRFYSWSEPAATFGRHQSFQFVERALIKREGKPALSCARRITGGGLVFHGEDLTFSMTFPWREPSTPAEIYQRLHHLIGEQLRQEGISLNLKSEPSSTAGLNKVCFSVPEKSDITTLDGIKILGGALCRKNKRGLYQGSFKTSLISLSLNQIKQAIFRAASIFKNKKPEEKINFLDHSETRLLVDKYRSQDWRQRVP